LTLWDQNENIDVIMSILRRLFGPDKDEIWRQLAEEIRARFEQGTWRKGSRVQIDVNEWTVTLDTYTVSAGHSHQVFTRMRAPFVNRDGFRFTVHCKGFLSNLGKALGMQDLEVGIPDFDERYIIKSNEEHLVRALFGNARIRELLDTQPSVHFQIKDDEGWFGPKFPEGVDELCFHVRGIIKDIPRLKQLFDLFAEVLQQLCRMGSAYQKDPGVEL
jgi:hypothetical protein